MDEEIEKYKQLIYEFATTNIHSDEELSNVQRVKEVNYKKILFLLKKLNNIKELMKDWRKLELDDLLVVIEKIESLIENLERGL